MLTRLAMYAVERPWRLSLLSCLLCAPAVGIGLVLDDYFLAHKLLDARGEPRWSALFSAFSFVARGELPALRERGIMPWWSDPNLTLDFMRPLASLSHALDFAFVRAPAWMHVESLLLLLALNVAVCAWYRRLFADLPRVAGLAMLLYVLAPGHGVAASWLANRNSVLAALFGVLSLLAHQRACRGEGKLFRLLAPLALLASLLSGELGTSTLAVFIAHALYLEQGSFRERQRGLLPALLVTGAWLCVYRLLGYGAAASSLYIDPLSNPLGYGRQLLTSLPILLFGQFGLPLISFTIMLSRAASYGLVALGALLGAWLLPRMVRVARADTRARFALLAWLLALLPIAATLPHDRLLIFADIPGFALLALVVDQAGSRLGAGALRALVATRLALSGLLLPAYAISLVQQAGISQAPFQHALRGPEVARQSVIVVAAPCAYFWTLLPWMRELEGGPIPARVRVLAPALYPLSIDRADARTLTIRAEHGLLQPHGSWRGEATEPPGWLSPVYLAQVLNQFVRADWEMHVGSRVVLSDLAIEVVEVTSAGYPRSVRVRFAEPLEHSRYRFVRVDGRQVVPFVLPAIGERIELAPVLR